MARRVGKDVAVAWINEKPGDEWPGTIKWDGPGYYLVDSEDSDNHTQANYGEKVEWEKSTPDKEEDGQVIPDHENNEGHFVYASGSDNEG